MKQFNRLQKIFFTVAFVLVLGSIVASVALAQQSTVKVAYTSNLRNGPGTGYSVVGVAYPGDVFAVYGRQSGWVSIGGDRWIAGWLTNDCNDPKQVCEFLEQTAWKKDQ